MTTGEKLVQVEDIGSRIRFIRGQKVIMDSDLAMLYGVPTKVLNQAVKRNIERFPEDFIFQLSEIEEESLRSQIVTSNGRGGRRYMPYAFTEHGAVMLANILRSKRAIDMSVYVVRAFIRLREMISRNRELAKKMDELERTVATHDKAICSLFDAIRKLMIPPEPKRRRIGFLVGDKKE